MTKSQSFNPSPELERACQIAGVALNDLISYIQVINPSADRTKATLAAAAILRLMPEVIENNPGTRLHLKTALDPMADTDAINPN